MASPLPARPNKQAGGHLWPSCLSPPLNHPSLAWAVTQGVLRSGNPTVSLACNAEGRVKGVAATPPCSNVTGGHAVPLPATGARQAQRGSPRPHLGQEPKASPRGLSPVTHLSLHTGNLCFELSARLQEPESATK